MSNKENMDSEKYKDLYVQSTIMAQARMGKAKRQLEAQGKALRLYPVALGMMLVLIVLFGLTIFGVLSIPPAPLAISLVVPLVMTIAIYEISHSQD